MFRLGRLTSIALIVVAVVVIVAIGLVDPQGSDIFPHCPFLAVTGYDCPGCGSQRALHQLLRLNVVEAFGYNPLLVCALPYIAGGVFVDYKVGKTPTPRLLKWRRRLYGPVAIVVVAATVMAYWVLRNI